MSNKLTRWFPGGVKPMRPGVYQRRWPSGVEFARWDGRQWRTSWSTAENAELHGRTVSGVQGDLLWRGLSEQPK